MGTVIVMRGIPGSGKSTWIKNNVPDAVVCSADLYFMQTGEYKFDPSKLGSAHAWCRLAYEVALRDNEPVVVVDNTNTTNKEMAFYIEKAEASGYDIVIVQLNTPADVAAARNVHGVPAEKVQQMAARMQELRPEWLKYAAIQLRTPNGVATCTVCGTSTPSETLPKGWFIRAAANDSGQIDYANAKYFCPTCRKENDE